MTKLFQCPGCGNDTLTKQCDCGVCLPQYILDFKRLPEDKPDWLKEMERHIDDP